MTSTPAEVSSLRMRFDHTLTRFLDRQRQFWSDADQEPLFEAVRRFILTGGKRMRPAFCYWGWRGAGGRGSDDGVVTVGAALELFHCFALIHDDIMDSSDRRRGQASMHRVFATQHAEQGWRGDPDPFGRHTALLCGDLCASWSEQLFAECDLPADRVRQAQRLFAAMRAEAIAGQYLDLLAQVNVGAPVEHSRSIDRALRVVRLKTGRYTVTRPLQIGATLAGADAGLLTAYASFGDPLGETFQLRDDVLGVFGDPELTGKPIFDDLRAGKPTVLLAMAFARADEHQAELLQRLVGNPGLDADGAATVAEIVRSTGALADVERLIEQRAADALAALAAASIPAEVRAELTRLAGWAVNRVS